MFSKSKPVHHTIDNNTNLATLLRNDLLNPYLGDTESERRKATLPLLNTCRAAHACKSEDDYAHAAARMLLPRRGISPMSKERVQPELITKAALEVGVSLKDCCEAFYALGQVQYTKVTKVKDPMRRQSMLVAIKVLAHTKSNAIAQDQLNDARALEWSRVGAWLYWTWERSLTGFVLNPIFFVGGAAGYQMLSSGVGRFAGGATLSTSAKIKAAALGGAGAVTLGAFVTLAGLVNGRILYNEYKVALQYRDVWDRAFSRDALLFDRLKRSYTLENLGIGDINAWEHDPFENKNSTLWVIGL